MTRNEMPLEAPPFEGEAHFVGSFPRDGELYDYYEISVEGKTSFIFVKSADDDGANEQG